LNNVLDKTLEEQQYRMYDLNYREELIILKDSITDTHEELKKRVGDNESSDKQNKEANAILNDYTECIETIDDLLITVDQILDEYSRDRSFLRQLLRYSIEMTLSNVFSRFVSMFPEWIQCVFETRERCVEILNQMIKENNNVETCTYWINKVQLANSSDGSMLKISSDDLSKLFQCTDKLINVEIKNVWNDVLVNQDSMKLEEYNTLKNKFIIRIHDIFYSHFDKVKPFYQLCKQINYFNIELKRQIDSMRNIEIEPQHQLKNNDSIEWNVDSHVVDRYEIDDRTYTSDSSSSENDTTDRTDISDSSASEYNSENDQDDMTEGSDSSESINSSESSGSDDDFDYNNYPINNNESIALYDDSNDGANHQIENSDIFQSDDSYEDTMDSSQSQNSSESSQSYDDSEYGHDDQMEQVHPSQLVADSEYTSDDQIEQIHSSVVIGDPISENYEVNHTKDARYGGIKDNLLGDVVVKIKNRKMSASVYLNKNLIQIERVNLNNIEYTQ